jgi:hypothetical protein
MNGYSIKKPNNLKKRMLSAAVLAVGIVLMAAGAASGENRVIHRKGSIL